MSVIEDTKVMQHRDRDLILRWIHDGIPSQQIQENLERKYPGKGNKNLHIGYKTINSFKEEYMVSGQLSAALVKEKSVPRWSKEKVAAKEALEKSSAYKAALKEIVAEELDLRRELLELLRLGKARLEFFFNELSGGKKMDRENEKVLLEQMKFLLMVHERYDKQVNGAKNSTDININVNIVKDQAGVIRDAIRETLADIDPNLSIEFMERLSIKMKDLEYNEEMGMIPLRE
jgi:hypothetical protein